jgi:hypothetical protein
MLARMAAADAVETHECAHRPAGRHRVKNQLQKAGGSAAKRGWSHSARLGDLRGTLTPMVRLRDLERAPCARRNHREFSLHRDLAPNDNRSRRIVNGHGRPPVPPHAMSARPRSVVRRNPGCEIKRVAGNHRHADLASQPPRVETGG